MTKARPGPKSHEKEEGIVKHILILSLSFFCAYSMAQDDDISQYSYEKIKPLFNIHTEVCKTITQIAYLVSTSKEKNVFNYELTRSIVQSISKQAEQTLIELSSEHLSKSERERFIEDLGISDFTDEITLRIYNPDNYSFNDAYSFYFNSEHYPRGGFCGWLANKCSAIVSDVLLNERYYSEDIYRVRFSLNRFKDRVSRDGPYISKLREQYDEVYKKCDRIESGD